jgi:hypothetical protein
VHTAVSCSRTSQPEAPLTAAWLLLPRRVYGGIHIPIDNEDGLKVGTQVGAMAYLKAARYWGGGASFTSSANQGGSA